MEQRDIKMIDIEIDIEDTAIITIDGATFSVGYAGEATFEVERDVVGSRGEYDVWGDVFHFIDCDADSVWAERSGIGGDTIEEGDANHAIIVKAFGDWVNEGGAGILEECATESQA